MPTERCQIYIDNNTIPVYSAKKLLQDLDLLEARGIIHGIDRTRFFNKANAFTTPSGFEPARGYFLISGTSANKLKNNSINESTHSVTFQFGSRKITYEKLLVVQCESLTGGNGDLNDAMYLCELADLRILGPLTSINRAYNLRAPDGEYYKASVVAGVAYTYEEIVDSIWTLMPPSFGALNKDGAQFSLIGTPSNYAFHGISAWDALKKVLDDINHVLTVDRSGEFYIEAGFDTTNQDFANDADAASEFLFVKSDDKISVAHKIPETISVYFPKYNNAWQLSTDNRVLSANDAFREDPLYEIPVATGIYGAIAGTSLPVHDTMVATYNELGAIQNLADLTLRATEVVSQYKNALTVSDGTFYHAYSTPCLFEPGIQVSCVTIADFGGGIITTVRGNYRARQSSPALDKHRDAGRSDDVVPENLSLSPKETNAPPVARRYELSERFAIVQPETALNANNSAMAKVMFGTNAANSISLSQSTLPHRIKIFEVTGKANYSTTDKLFVWFDLQTSRWVVISAAPQKGFRFYNADSEACPPHGVLFAEEAIEDADGLYFSCVKPNTTYDCLFLVNLSDDEVPAGEFGYGSWLTEGGLVAVNSTTTPDSGDGYGTHPNEWVLYPYRLGFTITSNTTQTINGQICVQAIQAEIKTLIAKMTSTIDLSQTSPTPGQQSGTAKLYYLVGTDHERQEAGYDDITVFDFMMNKDDKIEEGTWVVVTPYGQRFNEFVIINAYCAKDNTGNPSSQLAASMLASPPDILPPPDITTAVSSTIGSVGPLV